MVITFIVSIIVVGIFDSIIDTVMDKLAPLVSDSPQKTVALAVGMFALNLAVYAVCGFVFFGITRKNIRKESERQVKEKDLIYAAIAHDLKTPMTSVTMRSWGRRTISLSFRRSISVRLSGRSSQMPTATLKGMTSCLR